jgi:cobalt/nickel transport system ATP-binding protein
MSEPLLELRGLRFEVAGRVVLDGVDFTLQAGERVALVGPNGAGKTSLLHLLVGLRRPSAGSIRAFGGERSREADFREVRARAGLLFQDSDDQLFCPTVLEDVAFGPLNLGRAPREALAIAHETLGLLGLADFAERVTHRLSGGEKRLVALAAVLAMRPEVLLMDEPTNGLDERAEERLIGYLARSALSMVFVSHDRRLVERLATRAVVLDNGRLEEALLHAHAHRHSHLHVHARGLADEHSHGGAAPPPRRWVKR